MRSNNASMRQRGGLSRPSANPHGYSLCGGSLAVILALLALAGCATTPPAPVRVDVPVMVPCIGAVPARPVYEFDKLALAATDGEKILALARDWPRGRKYEEVLEAVVAGCYL